MIPEVTWLKIFSKQKIGTDHESAPDQHQIFKLDSQSKEANNLLEPADSKLKYNFYRFLRSKRSIQLNEKKVGQDAPSTLMFFYHSREDYRGQMPDLNHMFDPA